jgi:hypothetical protein
MQRMRDVEELAEKKFAMPKMSRKLGELLMISRRWQ